MSGVESSTAALARKSTSLEPDLRVLERSDTVLWTLAPGGIVLHNFALHCFLELDEVGYRLWGYLDGARTVEDAVRLVAASGDEEKVRETISTLVEYGFVTERP